jgi:hypothetical protein
MSVIVNEFKVNIYSFVAERTIIFLGSDIHPLAKKQYKLDTSAFNWAYPLMAIKNAILTTDMHNGLLSSDKLTFSQPVAPVEPDSTFVTELDEEACTVDIYFKKHPSLRVKYKVIRVF